MGAENNNEAGEKPVPGELLIHGAGRLVIKPDQRALHGDLDHHVCRRNQREETHDGLFEST